MDELPDSAGHCDQECAVVAFDQILRRIWCRIKLRRARLPSPQTSFRPRPEIASLILVQQEHSATQTAVPSVALGAAPLNRAEFRRGSAGNAHPYCSLTILKERGNKLSSKFWV